MAQSEDEEYFLGVSKEELNRLGRQHQAWLPETQQLIQNAKLNKSKSILDIGCGPGFTSVELSKLCPQSKVYGLDKSSVYHEHLANNLIAELSTNIEYIKADISEFNQKNKYGGAFCRWVLAFLISDLENVLQNIYNALTPGSPFAIMEYLTLDSFTSSPPTLCFDTYKKAWIDFYLHNGGDASIGAYLPVILKKVGFEIVNTNCVGGLAPTNHRWWNWWRDAFDHFAPRFVEDGLMTQENFDGLRIYWGEQEQNPDGFIYTGIISQIIAVKP